MSYKCLYTVVFSQQPLNSKHCLHYCCCCLQGALAASTLAAVRGAGEAVARAQTAAAATAAAAGHNRGKSIGAAAAKKGALPTVAKGFMESMTELSRVLDKTTCSFIR
jgi:hypothetical protein